MYLQAVYYSPAWQAGGYSESIGNAWNPSRALPDLVSGVAFYGRFTIAAKVSGQLS